MNVVNLKAEAVKMREAAPEAADATPLSEARAANEPVAPAAAESGNMSAEATPAADAAPDKPLYVRTRAPEWLVRSFAMLCGLALFVGVWAALAKDGRIPGPISTWHSAVEVFGDPFY